MEDLTGMQLGQYRIVAPLGEGGMAAVYKAYQSSMDRYVALKVLPRHFASDPEFTGRFEQEARVIARLQHVHVLPVHDFGTSEGYTYIVMPFIETGTVAELLNGEPLPLKQIRQIISQTGKALAHAHSQGLVHRDVKPSNILIDRDGNCLLTDFGITKVVEGTMQFTQTGAIIGTPTYMSPEQIQGETIDGRSDIYSLGVVMYEMATGRPPFKAETPPAIFVKHLHDPLPPPRTFNPELPDPVERVILKCLSKDPRGRFATMQELVNSVQDAIPDITIPSETKETILEDVQPTIVEQPGVGSQDREENEERLSPLEMKSKPGSVGERFGLSKILLILAFLGVVGVCAVFAVFSLLRGNSGVIAATVTLEATQIKIAATISPPTHLSPTATEVLMSTSTPTVTSTETSVPTPEELSAIITYPIDRTSVDHIIDVTGIISRLESDMRAFVCIQSTAFGRFIWPQGEITPDSSGNWIVEGIYQDVGYDYETFVVVTDSMNSAEILASQESHVLGFPVLPEDTLIISPIVTVTRE